MTEKQFSSWFARFDYERFSMNLPKTNYSTRYRWCDKRWNIYSICVVTNVKWIVMTSNDLCKFLIFTFFPSFLTCQCRRTEPDAILTAQDYAENAINNVYARKYIRTYNSCRRNVVAIRLAVDAIERWITIYHVVNVINVVAYTINRIQRVYMPPKSK